MVKSIAYISISILIKNKYKSNTIEVNLFILFFNLIDFKTLITKNYFEPDFILVTQIYKSFFDANSKIYKFHNLCICLISCFS